MSFWSKLKSAHRTTVDNVAAEALQRKYIALMNMAMALPPARSAEVMLKFSSLAEQLQPHFSNWSTDGYFKMAARIQSDASNDQHLDVTSAVAKGLVSVWIECHPRSHHPAIEPIKAVLDFVVANPGATLEDFLDSFLEEDDLPEGAGYGIEKSNPIRLTGALDTTIYMGSLYLGDARVTWEWRETTSGSGGHEVDIYELSCDGTSLGALFADKGSAETIWAPPDIEGLRLLGDPPIGVTPVTLSLSTRSRRIPSKPQQSQHRPAPAIPATPPSSPRITSESGAPPSTARPVHVSEAFCPACRHRYRGPVLVGTTVKCPLCLDSFVIKEKQAEKLVQRSDTSAQSQKHDEIRSSPTKDLRNLMNSLSEPTSTRGKGYGYDPHDPILCRDISSSRFYLLALQHKGKPVAFERRGSMQGPNGRILDHYRISGPGGEIAELYIDAHAGNAESRRVPDGFTFVPKPP